MAQVVDFRGVLRGFRHRRGVLLAAVLLGLVASGMFVVVSPTTYVAKARVVLPPSPVDASGHDTRDINTEVQIVRGAAVLGPTTKAVQPAIAPAAMQRAISVRGISSQILEISAHSTSGARASQLANAVAASYVAFADDTATAEANATAAAYSQEVGQLNEQVQQLDRQIASNTAALSGLGPADARRQEAVIDTLRSGQSALAQQLNVDQSRVADAQLQAQLSRQGTQVLQPALTPTHPASPKPLLDLALGVLAGLLIGGVVALAVENGDHRLRARDGISDAVGAPVLASLAVAAVDRPDRCQALLGEWEPSVVESYALRQAFARLGIAGSAGSTANLVVVALPRDVEAAALALQLAVFSAGRGIRTALVFASHDQGGAGLRASCQVAAPGVPSPRPGLAIHGASGNVDAELLQDSELVITLVVADSGPLVVPSWDRPTRSALSVSGGGFTAERLEAVAAACLEAGHPLGGVFVANPDSTDRSTGQRGAILAVGGTGSAGTRTHEHGAPATPAAVATLAGNGREPAVASGNGGSANHGAGAGSPAVGSDAEGRASGG